MGCFLIITREDYDFIQIMGIPGRSSSDIYSKVAFISPKTGGVLVHVQGDNKADTQRLVDELKSIMPEARLISNEVAAQPQSHHIFPQKHRDFFEKNDIPIHDFTVQLDADYHHQIHPGSEGYTKAWDLFVDACEQEGLSSQEIKQAAIRYAGQLLTHFDMGGLDINRHRKHKK